MPERIEVLVTVKAYPSASVKYGEAVCVAGIRTDTPQPSWVRLYPIEFRDLPIDKQFAKYEKVALDVIASSDGRPESRKPLADTIRSLGKLSTGKDRRWRERWRYVEPLLVESMCAAREAQVTTGRSLAAFRPAEVQEVIARPEEAWTDKQLNTLSQMSLFAQDKQILKKIPWRFYYRYSCGGSCKGHEQSIIDWEIHEFYRKCQRQHGEQEAVRLVRQRWLEVLCGPTRETVFFVGNQHLHPASFLVLGVFWPPKPSGHGENLQLGF
ncbi:MAG: hypothetical protein ACRDY2_03915 [Acidimicrobiales bacterium]